ncbi:MAG: thymidine phosphorylase [Ramlibacter sp.]
MATELLPPPAEIIRRKRDRQRLAGDDIAAFVRGVVDGSWGDAQVGAMAMAMFIHGLDADETVALTAAMTGSGARIDWSGEGLPGPVVDKHSTGGVGDKVSLMLAPLLAACGAFVPMLSGRGLGHTGGTLDKLDAIPGYRSLLPVDALRRTVRSVGCAIVGQTDDLAPADRRLYATRHLTGTVESVPLITASILSKKLAAGLQALVLDVKAGNGAFAADLPMARELARSLVEVAAGAGLPAVARITDMSQVLGRSCGNALEVREAVAFLRGDCEPRLLEVTRALGADALHLAGLAASHEQALAQLDAALADGRALDRFARMVAACGGPADFVERPDAYLAAAPVTRPVPAARDGWVAAMDTRDIGLAVLDLGGGRRLAGDRIDPRVGLTDVVPLGRPVRAGEPLALVHARDDASARAACARLARAIGIGDAAPAAGPAVLERIAP